jgi:hypothetical protein
MQEKSLGKVIKSSITLKHISHIVIVLPPFINHFFNVCISYRVGPVRGYEQEPEQEVLVDPQAPSFKETSLGSYRPCLRVFSL